jgi:oxalate decarboxylase/phosphoglucose isomerase-like protein (cupin superfamily)
MTTETTQQPRGGYSKLAYDQWIESLGVPIYRGHFISDLRTVDVGWWEERQCNVAFLQFMGMEGISEGRITEIAPGQTLPPQKLGLGETIYVLSGHGLASLWSGEGPKRNFEWQPHSMFHVPRYSTVQLTNARGDAPARILHYNYLPMAMTVIPDASFFYNNPYEDPTALYADGDTYSQAKAVLGSGAKDKKAEADGATRDDSIPAASHGGAWWVGNFFPDMAAWDKLSPYRGRGAGGYSVKIMFPNSGMSASMSVFDSRMYKKAHLHGPGRVIVIPAGEGYSILWEPNGTKVICPWGEAAVFTPPGGWYHQHFNLGDGPARYLKFGHLPILSGAGGMNGRDQIEYIQEEQEIRDIFDEKLAAKNLTSLMPPEVYTNPNYEWDYGDDD